MSKRLGMFLEKYNILYKQQHRFRVKHSTIHPILYLLKDIAEANDKITKNLTLAVFLELSKAQNLYCTNTFLWN